MNMHEEGGALMSCWEPPRSDTIERLTEMVIAPPGSMNAQGNLLENAYNTGRYENTTAEHNIEHALTI